MSLEQDLAERCAKLESLLAEKTREVEELRDGALEAIIRNLRKEMDSERERRVIAQEACVKLNSELAEKNAALQQREEQLQKVIYYDAEAEVWVGSFGEVVSQGTTPAEALEAVKSALRLTLETMQQQLQQREEEIALCDDSLRNSMNSAAELREKLRAAEEQLKAKDVALKSVVDWFDAIREQQRAALVIGQSLESASDNWDEATDLAPLDIEPIREALKGEV